MNDGITAFPEISAKAINEPQKSRILSGVSYMDKLLIDVEEILWAPSSHTFPRYKNPLTPVQVRVVRDYIKRLRQQIAQVLSGLQVSLPNPRFDSTHSIRVTLQFIEVAIEELSPERLIGYGVLPADVSNRLTGGLQEIKGIVRQMDSYLMQRPDADLSLRIARLPEMAMLGELLSLLTAIIDRHGFIEFRGPLARILEKVETPTYEIAFFGRVSAGKSSLLNRMIGTDLLPTGVTPVTAVPTRIRNRAESALLVWTAEGGLTRYDIDRIRDFVTEACNPGNYKRIIRVLAELPLAGLPEEVVLVDTPGLGSLTLEGAAETLAYLPQCDLGVVLVDASSNLHSDDIATLDAIRSASALPTVILSKSDLIPAADVEQLVAYTSRHVTEQLGSNIDVAPLSSRPEMGHLLNKWVTDQIAPRIADARRLAEESNQRKASNLAGRILHALEMAARRVGSHPRAVAVDSDLRSSEKHLREAAGLVERTNKDCFRITGEIREATSDAIQALATAAMSVWESRDPSIQLDRDWIEKEVNAVARNKTQELARLVQNTARTMSEALNEAAEATSIGKRNERSSLDSLVKELPPAQFPGCEVILRKPLSLSVSRSVARWSVRHHLESKCGALLNDFFDSHGRALELWFRRTLIELDREFNNIAEVYRAQLQRSIASGGVEKLDKDAISDDISLLKQKLELAEAFDEAEPHAAV